MKPETQLLDSLVKAKANQQQVQTFFHLNLSEAAICVQCEAIFKTAANCPACDSITVKPLTTWIPQVESHSRLLIAREPQSLDESGLWC